MTDDRRVTAALVGGVAAWNILQNNVPRRAYGPLNAAGIGLVIVASRRVGLTVGDLGMGPGAMHRGLRSAGPIAATVALGLAALSVSPTTRRLLRDERVERNGPEALVREALFRIPVGTALFEEVVFRGLLQGWFRRRHGRSTAVSASSGLFGLWHIIPALRTLRVYRSGRLSASRRRAVASTAAAVGLSAAGGAGFALLRDRSRSLVAPIVLHATMNVASYVAAWFAAGTADASSE